MWFISQTLFYHGTPYLGMIIITFHVFVFVYTMQSKHINFMAGIQ